MAKNILIFSDGTGQRGGVSIDERRSNIYKLYWATRCGPDSTVNPLEQFAFYDPGIGTLPGGLSFIGIISRKIYNIVGQATGLGLTMNIIDCYSAIIQSWQPGDRIFLFGFSRGAYTVRCLAAVLSFCGVPTRCKDGSPLKRDIRTIRKIAKEGVKKVYQHVGSPKDTKFLPQRIALAKRFREEYGSEINNGSNAYPYFIGVYDTVAALVGYGAVVISSVLVIITLICLSWGLSRFWFSLEFWFGGLTVATAITLIGFYIANNLKFSTGLKEFSFWKTLHFTDLKMKFYDQELSKNVKYARHALAIDENRADFQRVPWGDPKEWRKQEAGEPIWFEQLWFSGNHSDIGGSYLESESRLSDITFKWMVEAAQQVPNGIKIDHSVLQLYPSATGMQHDECKSWIFKFAKKENRKIPSKAYLHPTVYERFGAEEVLHLDVMGKYRPEALRDHEKVKQYYRPKTKD